MLVNKGFQNYLVVQLITLCLYKVSCSKTVYTDRNNNINILYKNQMHVNISRINLSLYNSSR